MKLSSSSWLVLWLLVTPAVALSAAERPPNQIFILVDDMGRDWVGAYGSSFPTPNFDRLAAGGERFETAWCTPLCTPTRVSLLTGQYPYHNGWTVHYDVPRWGGRGLDPSRFVTMGQLLHGAGYATAIAGKWQINDLRPDRAIMKEHGFDEYCLWTGVESDNPASEKRYWDAFLECNGQRQAHIGGYGPDLVQSFAFDFIRRHRDRPFFLYYPMIGVHAPNEPTPLNRAHPPKGEAALYAGMVTYTDRQVGELLHLLDELGLADNTVIYFAGDNGSSTGGTLHGQPTPGGKAKVSDLGVHVPLIVRAPGLTRPGSVSHALVDFTDLVPTMMEIAHAPLPKTTAFDGRSLVPELKDANASAIHRAWIFTQYGKRRAVRDARYFLDNTGAFFDLEADPFQDHDLAADPTPALVAARQRLQAVLDERPADGTMPFPEYANAEQLLRDTMRKNQARRRHQE